MDRILRSSPYVYRMKSRTDPIPMVFLPKDIGRHLQEAGVYLESDACELIIMETGSEGEVCSPDAALLDILLTVI